MKKLGLIIGVVVLLLIAGVAYTQLNKSSQTPNTTNTATEKPKTAEDTVKGTIQSLLGVGKSVTCTVNDETQGSTGTIFVSDKKMAGDFAVKVEGKSVESHMISDGTYSYIWSSDQTQGVKIKIDQVKVTPGGNEQTSSQGGFDLNKQANIKCTPWTPDESKFTPPANIKFTDLTQMLNQIQPKTTGNSTAPQTTSPCDQIADAAAKAQCIKALSDQ